MMPSSKAALLAEKNTTRAWEIIRELGVEDAWRSIGAKVNLVGSLKTGLLVKHLDIDFHVYTPMLSVQDSFRAVAALARHPAVCKIEYVNLADTEEACFEWHAWFRDRDGQTWQIDMIHIRQGTRFDGFFENVAERIASCLTDETKAAIVQLKYDTPDSETIMGIAYYMAVLRDGVRHWPEFERWLAANPLENITTWMP